VVPVVLDASEFLIIDKPAGMPGHPISVHDFNTVTHWAFSHFPELRTEFNEETQPTLVPHRLDT
jgi:23S rRNA-/tRNA-specific pseudouridylate synthase